MLKNGGLGCILNMAKHLLAMAASGHARDNVPWSLLHISIGNPFADKSELLSQASLKKAGKLEILGSLEDNEADDDAGSEISEDGDADDAAAAADETTTATVPTQQNGTHKSDGDINALTAAIGRTHIQD